MTSDGYQSFNFNRATPARSSISTSSRRKTVLTGFSGVIQLNSNGRTSAPRAACSTASRPHAYSCTNANTANGLQPYTGAGIKFLLTEQLAIPLNWFDYQYNRYQVPTDFEYVSLKTEFGKGWYLEVKPYTYNYDNGELYANATPITEVDKRCGRRPTSSGSRLYRGTAVEGLL